MKLRTSKVARGWSYITLVAAVLYAATAPARAESPTTVRAWGWNVYGQLGNGTTMNSPVPDRVMSLTDVVAVAGGAEHSLALKSDGTVWAWGGNYGGELGVGLSANWDGFDQSSTPVQVVGPNGIGTLTGVKAIAAGYYHSLVLRTDGTVWQWGSLISEASLVPTQVPGPGGAGYLTDVVAIAQGALHCLAIRSDGTVWTWGQNNAGQLGDGTRFDSYTPVQVLGPGGVGFFRDVRAVAGGYDYCLALKIDGTVWAWGWNSFGQLGDGNSYPANSLTPVQTLDMAGVVAIAAGDQTSLALKSDGTVWEWGLFAASPTPIAVSGLNRVKAIAAGIWHGLALKTDGTVWAWGYNWAGQLGDGTFVDRQYPPAPVRGLGNVSFIAAGILHSLAIK